MIEGFATGPATEEGFKYACTWADGDCSWVYKRPDTPDGQTRLLEVRGTTWTSTSTASGACTAPATGSHAQEDVIEWTRGADGSV